MIGKIRNFDKKKYEILSTSRIKMYDDEEKMQIKKTERKFLGNGSKYKIIKKH